LAAAAADVAPPMQSMSQQTYEAPRVAEPAEAETVINLAVPPRPVEAEVVVPARPPAPPPRPREALPPVSMSLPPDSGLELVETRSKATIVPEPEPEAPAGPRRARPPRVVIQDEPLQIIETRKEGPPPAG
jgi:hypothetical protein